MNFKKEKQVSFVGASRDDLRAFPKPVTIEMGAQLMALEMGLMPAHWKTMRRVGSGVNEICVRGEDGWYRTVYIAKYDEAIYVLHCFSKKTNQTSKSDIDIAKLRLKAVIASRKKSA